MLIYRVEYTESESDIKNYNFLYKKHKKRQNTFEKKTKNKIVFFSKIPNVQKLKFLFCILYTFHNSYFFILFWFLCFYMFEKMENFKNSSFYLVLCIRSIIPIFRIFIFLILYIYIFIFSYLYIYLYNYLTCIFLYIYIFI